MAVQFAVRLALLAFAATLLDGAVSGGEFLGTVQTALLRLGGFYVVGLGSGVLAGWLADELAAADFRSWQDAKNQAPAASSSGG